MEYMTPRGLSLKTLLCVCVCLITCVNLGLSLTCREATCGHGTKRSSCNNDGYCTCSNHFSNRQEKRLFGQDVQYCLHKCDDDHPCPGNYLCTPGEPSERRCVCAVGYRRSFNGECVATCAGLSCATGLYCSEGQEGPVCIGQICEMGYQVNSTGGCTDNDECLGKQTCDDKQNTFCVNTPGSFQCDCIQGYIRSTDNNECKDIDECHFNDTICEDKNNTVCANTQGSFNCKCLPGYSPDNNTSCQDMDECVKEPCGEHSVCKNVPGNYSCRCREGYTLTMDENSTCVLNERSADRLRDGNGGSSLGLTVGVTVGVLVLLGLIVAAIFVRRRRNSKKSSEGGAQFSSGEPERKQNSCNGYDNVSLDNGDVDLPTETRKEKTVSVEYSNSKIPQNKIARNSSSISVEYSNNKILSSTKRHQKKPVSSKPTQHPTEGDGGLKDQGGYGKEGILPHNNHPEMMAKSPNPGITAKCDDTEAYNTLDAFTLSDKNKSPTKHQIAGVTSESESQGVYNTPYEEHVLPNNNKNKEYMAAFPDPVTGDTVDDSEAYNTLDAFNLSTQNKPKTDTRMEEDVDHYNIIL